LPARPQFLFPGSEAGFFPSSIIQVSSQFSGPWGPEREVRHASLAFGGKADMFFCGANVRL
jgi:hypothetical protein